MLRAGYDYTKVNPRDAVRGTKVLICFIHGLYEKVVDEFARKVEKNSAKVQVQL